MSNDPNSPISTPFGEINLTTVTAHLETVEIRLAELEQFTKDTDYNFNKLDQLLNELEARLDLIQPRPPTCAKCGRIVNTTSGKCRWCGVELQK